MLATLRPGRVRDHVIAMMPDTGAVYRSAGDGRYSPARPPKFGHPRSICSTFTDRAPATAADEPVRTPPPTGRPWRSARPRSCSARAMSMGRAGQRKALCSRERIRSISRSGRPSELGRFPPIPYEVHQDRTWAQRERSPSHAHERRRCRRLQAMRCCRRLASSPRKDGRACTSTVVAQYLRDAALTMGELCHFLGREFVCGIFAWPAGGKRGILFGYEARHDLHIAERRPRDPATPGRRVGASVTVTVSPSRGLERRAPAR